MLLQLQEALLYLYDCGIKPDDLWDNNILIQKDGSIKIIDFDCWEEDGMTKKDLASALFLVAYTIKVVLKEPKASGNDLQEKVEQLDGTRENLKAALDEMLIPKKRCPKMCTIL